MTTITGHPEREVVFASEARRRIGMAHVLLAGAATIAALAMLTAVRPGVAETVVASPSALATAPGVAGFAADDPSDPGWSPPPDPGSGFPENPGWSSQSDPGWNVSPGWDFQPSP